MPTSARLEVANSPQITVKTVQSAGSMRRPQASFEAQPRIARLLAPKMGIGPYNQKKSSVFLRTPTILCFRYSIDEHEVSSLRKGKKCERNPSGVSFAFDSRPQATVCAAERFRTNKKRHASACLFLLVREMRLELTRRLPHAPQTCLSTYSSTLAYNFRLLSYYTHSFCICQVFYFFLAGCSITFLLALRPDIWYNTSCMYTKEGGRGGCRSFLFRRTMCAEAF